MIQPNPPPVPGLPRHDKAALIEQIEVAQLATEQLQALMHAVHLGLSDAEKLASTISAAPVVAKLRAMNVLIDILDNHQAQLSLVLGHISEEMIGRNRTVLAAG